MRGRTGGGEVGTTFISADQNSGSANVVFEDLIIRKPSIYTCIVFDTQGWQMRNLKFLSNFNYGNRDGIDPHNAQHLVIDDCLCLITDDSIAYSTIRDNIDADVAVKNCVMYNTGFRIGPWVGNNTRNFTVENCDRIKGPKSWGACFDIWAGGSLSNVRFRNMRIEDPGNQLMYMVTNWTDYYAGVKSGSIDNIRFENMSVEHVTSTNSTVDMDASAAANPITQPPNTTVTAGQTAMFIVAASGTGPLSYQWKFGSTNVGSNSATLSLVNAQAANAGS